MDENAIKLHCGAACNTWADQRRKRREAARKLRPRLSLPTNHISDEAFEICPNETSELIKSRQIVTESGLNHGEIIEAGEENMSTVNKNLQTTDLSSKQHSNGELKNVSSGNLGSDRAELMTNTTLNRGLSVKCTPQCLETLKFDRKVLKFQTNTKRFCPTSTTSETWTRTGLKHAVPLERKSPDMKELKSERKAVFKSQENADDATCSFQALDKKRKSPISTDFGEGRKKFVKSNDKNMSEQFFLEFVLTLTMKNVEREWNISAPVVLQIEWVSGQDKNSMYQLFQYFKNRFGSLML